MRYLLRGGSCGGGTLNIDLATDRRRETPVVESVTIDGDTYHLGMTVADQLKAIGRYVAPVKVEVEAPTIQSLKVKEVPAKMAKKAKKAMK